MEFNNKVVLVTGASSGIGASAAVAFSAAGAQVAMVGRNETKLKSVAAKCKSPLVLIADLRNDDDVKRIVEETIKKFGQLDILVNSAGLTAAGDLIDSESMMKSFDLIINTNLRGLVHVTSVAAPHIAKTKGNIINISSVKGLITPTLKGTTSYHVSKAAINHFSLCAAAELAPLGIRVNTISPGPVRSDFIINSKINVDYEFIKTTTSLNRISEPEEVSDLILFVASDKAKAITGSNFLCDNGSLIKRE